MDADVPQWLVQWIYDITAYYRAIMIYYYIIINKNENLILRGPTTSPHQGSWTPIKIKRVSNFALIQLLQTCSSALPLIAPVKQSILVQVPLRPSIITTTMKPALVRQNLSIGCHSYGTK